MILTPFDHQSPYRVAIYLRMSSDKQNRRSPEQQEEEIRRRLSAMGLSWTIVKVYRDDALSGKYQRNRPQYRRMLADIESGQLNIDLILMDTFSRIGRHDELQELRRELRNQHGVLILTALNNFADPTTVQGETYAAFEAVQARSENREKAHNVNRAKRNLVARKRWPGGKPPFGFRLESEIIENGGARLRKESRLVPDPRTDWIVRRMFERASATGHGQTLLARYLNEHEEIPDEYKPFNGSTVGTMLDNEIYYGDFVFPKKATDVINDARQVQDTPEEERMHVEDFCPGIVDRELWFQVQEIRDHRRRSDEEDGGTQKQIAPLAPGKTLRYLLTGLVRCDACGASMTPTSSGQSSTATGKYAYYRCPRAVDGNCGNHRYIHEGWLRSTVVDTVLKRLFPIGQNGTSEDVAAALMASDPFREVFGEVRSELERLLQPTGERHAALQAELKDLRRQMTGWRQSLGNPDLDPMLRVETEQDWASANRRVSEIESDLVSLEAAPALIDGLIDGNVVAERLQRLHEILGNGNVTRGNLELALHVDRIDCDSGGRVVLRTCKLGALAGVIDMLADSECPKPSRIVRPRRRARLRVEGMGRRNVRETLDWAADPHRFAGLDERWFHTDVFQIPEPTGWYQDHAVEVARQRAEGLTHQQLAEQFGVTVPTIRKALRHAVKVDPSLATLPKKMPRRQWHVDHVAEVLARHHAGMGVPQMARHFCRSEPTIRKAMDHAREFGLLDD
ncbi:MAG: recombinase family protein [Planctomycetaceae bacterium]|nr:recombinase family protein [Planctomycetaceae bacterium]